MDSTGIELPSGFVERLFAGHDGDELLGMQASACAARLPACLPARAARLPARLPACPPACPCLHCLQTPARPSSLSCLPNSLKPRVIPVNLTYASSVARYPTLSCRSLMPLCLQAAWETTSHHPAPPPAHCRRTCCTPPWAPTHKVGALGELPCSQHAQCTRLPGTAKGTTPPLPHPSCAGNLPGAQTMLAAAEAAAAARRLLATIGSPLGSPQAAPAASQAHSAPNPQPQFGHHPLQTHQQQLQYLQYQQAVEIQAPGGLPAHVMPMYQVGVAGAPPALPLLLFVFPALGIVRTHSIPQSAAHILPWC
jgi:hypothetical protein